MGKKTDQNEKDVQSVVKYLKLTDPKQATRKHAEEMLQDMEAVSHLIAHKVVSEERKQKV